MKSILSLSVLALTAVAIGQPPRPVGLPAPRPVGITVPGPVGLPVIPHPGHPPGVVGLPIPPTPAYQDIVKITVNYGTTNTLYHPNETLRPYRGDLLRVSIPHSCGATSIRQIAAWGRTLQGGQRVQLSLIPMGSSPVYGASAQVFQVNGGQPATIREIGMLVTTGAFNCQITFEQANRNDIGGGTNECDLNTPCPANVDNTRYCEASSNFASYVEDGRSGDNSCTVTNRLKRQICRAGHLPSQFQISCR